MVGVDAALGVVGVLLIRTPASFVPEHEECEDLDSSSVQGVQGFVERLEVQQAIWHVVVFYAYSDYGTEILLLF